jgi:UDP-N-acetylglucosamine diphosphorylase/glucosamine-1-phosphate N-acetyltransferase
MRICLFEQRPETLAPLSLTRPVFDLLCGITSLADKQRRHFGLDDWGMLIRPALGNLQCLRQPAVPCNDADWLKRGDLVLVNGRWLPPVKSAEAVDDPHLAVVDGEIAYVVVPAEQARRLTFDNLPLLLANWRDTLPQRNAGGRLLDYPWQLVQHNGEMIARDFAAQRAGGVGADRVQVVGSPHDLSIDPTAHIDPFVVADTTAGPVIVDAEAVVTAFTRLEGPCYIGPGTHVLGAKIRAGTTLGPHCRVGGEVEASIIQGYSNKYHEGFLGHSYLGEWVNLGAGTHNSDLRNDYEEVSVTIAGQAIATGQSKVGCFIGDHTKTGLGTLLNTGSNIGMFCNLLPAGRLAPKHVPSFTSWWKGELRDGFPIDQLLQTARQVMKRRGAFLTSEHVILYRRLLEETALERQRVLEKPESSPRRRAA